MSGEEGVTVTAWCSSEGNVWTVNIEVRGDEERGRLRGLGEGWVCIWVMWGVFRVETGGVGRVECFYTVSLCRCTLGHD